MAVICPACLMRERMELHPEDLGSPEGEDEHAAESCCQQCQHPETAHNQPEQATGSDHTDDQDDEGIGVGVQ